MSVSPIYQQGPLQPRLRTVAFWATHPLWWCCLCPKSCKVWNFRLITKQLELAGEPIEQMCLEWNESRARDTLDSLSSDVSRSKPNLIDRSLVSFCLPHLGLRCSETRAKTIDRLFGLEVKQICDELRRFKSVYLLSHKSGSLS